MKVTSQTATPKAIIVTRVSTDGQSDNTSHVSQFSACSKKAAELGAEVIKHFEETVSGALYRARPDIQKALEEIEAGHAHYLLIAKLDRAGRDVDNLRDIRRRVERAGGELVFADGLNFEQGAVGNLMYTQLAGFAEFEREVIRERMVRGLRAKASAGIQVARTWSPYGYHIVQRNDVVKGDYPPGSEGTYHLIPEQARWVREIYQRKAAGHSLRQICLWLHEQGVPSPWKGTHWRPASMRRILQNPVNKGEPAYGRTRRQVDEKRAEAGINIYYERPVPESEQIKLKAPAIVDAGLWQAANDRLVEDGGNRGRVDRKFLLTGLLSCPHCGGRMDSRTVGGKKRRAQLAARGVERFQFYICPRSVRYTDPAAHLCPYRSHAAAPMERLIIEGLLRLLREPEMLETAARAFHATHSHSDRREQRRGQIDRLRKTLGTLEKRERAAAESKIEAKISGADSTVFDTMLGEIGAEKARLQEQLRDLEAQAHQVELRLVLPTEGLDALEAALRSPDVPPMQKQQLLRQLIRTVYPTPTQKRFAVVQIVLRTEGNDGPVYILTHRELPKGATELSLRIEPALPFPSKPPRKPFLPAKQGS